MTTIAQWLATSITQLKSADIDTAKLDAEIILAHTIRKPRTYLHAHNDDTISARDIEIANARLDLRLDRVPIAYIIGHKEFYGRRFKVTTETLIPRPESEDCIEVLLSLLPKNASLIDETVRLVDVGTGSGCLGITAKLESPDLDVTLLDVSPYALKLAAANATTLHADVHIIKSDLLQNFPFQFTYMIANLPYVDQSWERSPETNHEPSLALFADDNGTALIKKLIKQSESSIKNGGYIVLEADPVQHDDIIEFAKKHGFSLATTQHYCIALQKS
jgi:release factor glutamine methyltransferase